MEGFVRIDASAVAEGVPVLHRAFLEPARVVHANGVGPSVRGEVVAGIRADGVQEVETSSAVPVDRNEQRLGDKRSDRVIDQVLDAIVDDYALVVLRHRG